MTAKEELKELIAKMNVDQFEWFIDQVRLVLYEEAGRPDPQKSHL